MALLKLYESAGAMSLPNAVLGETVNGNSSGWYMRRYDCVVLFNTGFGGCFKIFRSGHIVRVCRAALGGSFLMGFDANVDKAITLRNGAPHLYNDPIGMLYNYQDETDLNPGAFLPDAHTNLVVYRDAYYPSPVGGTAVVKADYANGDTLATITFTGTLSFGANRIDITDDGWMCLMDFDNGSAGVIRFRHIDTGEMYESTTDRANFMWVDRVHNNIWIWRLSDNKMVVYSMQPAPANMSAVTMGANRCRYREDNLQVTLTGSNNEPARDWPVEWLMSTSEGHLEFEVTKTDNSGIARNRYCGPGANDYVGGSLTITARTAY